MIRFQELMVTLGRAVSRRPRVRVKSGDKETGKIEGQKMALWLHKNHKGYF